MTNTLFGCGTTGFGFTNAFGIPTPSFPINPVNAWNQTIPFGGTPFNTNPYTQGIYAQNPFATTPFLGQYGYQNSCPTNTCFGNICTNGCNTFGAYPMNAGFGGVNAVNTFPGINAWANYANTNPWLNTGNTTPFGTINPALLNQGLLNQAWCNQGISPVHAWGIPTWNNPIWNNSIGNSIGLTNTGVGAIPGIPANNAFGVPCVSGFGVHNPFIQQPAFINAVNALNGATPFGGYVPGTQPNTYVWGTSPNPVTSATPTPVATGQTVNTGVNATGGAINTTPFLYGGIPFTGIPTPAGYFNPTLGGWPYTTTPYGFAVPTTAFGYQPTAYINPFAINPAYAANVIAANPAAGFPVPFATTNPANFPMNIDGTCKGRPQGTLNREAA